jgi:hypothetical protein
MDASLRIAWRYQHVHSTDSSSSNPSQSDFDLTDTVESTKLYPNLVRHWYIEDNPFNMSVTETIESWLVEDADSFDPNNKKNGGSSGTPNLLRICINGFASPLWDEEDEAIRFLCRLKSSLRRHHAVALVTLHAVGQRVSDVWIISDFLF